MKILITGASSGIGRDMARYLSSKENELILVSSNKDKLESVSKALINSSVYVCDLSNNDNVNKLCEYILKEKPDFVINNAGFGAFGFYDLFARLSGINSSTTTYIIAPAAKHRKNGKMFLTLTTSKAPITPLIGSTIPLSCP